MTPEYRLCLKRKMDGIACLADAFFHTSQHAIAHECEHFKRRSRRQKVQFTKTPETKLLIRHFAVNNDSYQVPKPTNPAHIGSRPVPKQLHSRTSGPQPSCTRYSPPLDSSGNYSPTPKNNKVRPNAGNADDFVRARSLASPEHHRVLCSDY